MFGNLRVKLLISYVGVITVCLILAGSLGLFWMQRYEREAALKQARSEAQALDHLLQALPADEGRGPGELLRYLRARAFATEVRLLFLDERGSILQTEPGSDLKGQQIPLPPASAFTRQDSGQPLSRWVGDDGTGYFLLFASLPPMLDSQPGAAPQATVYHVALAVPIGNVEHAWREWLPPLIGIAALALVFSALVSYLVFASITRPVEAMTRAAEEMAGGQYGHHIPVPSQDEIGRLAMAFNHMAREVERAQRAQRDFMVNISHDLQTPLTSIRGFSQAIVDRAINNVVGLRRAGEIIHQEAGTMEEILDDLLDLSRLEAGQFEMAKIPVNLAYVLRGCVAKFAERAQQAAIGLTLSLPETLPMVLGDSERLAQVFGNLVDNALRFTPADGQVVVDGYVLGGSADRKRSSLDVLGDSGDVSALRNGQWVVITVSDTGIGIPKEEMGRIFERFYQADKSRTSKEGAGLGLSISREIVQTHGGQITVSSQPGKGSQFHVALPVPPAERPGNTKKALG